MTRLLACVLCLTLIVLVIACAPKETATTANANHTAQTEPAPATPKPEAQQPAQPGELEPGQASGSYTAKGEKVELKYAYAGRAKRFGADSLVVLVTETPIPPDAVAAEISDTPMLEGEKIRGLEYVIDDTSMWVRFHPGQFQESSGNKLKEYKVENDVIRVVDENDGSLTDGKYSRSVKFVAAIRK